MSLLPNPVSIFQDALRTVDSGLQNISYAADALQRSRSDLPPVTSDYNERERESFISQTIGAIRDQVQRGLPVASLPSETIRALLDAFAVSKQWEEGLDDRKLFLDYVFVFLSRAPPSNFVKGIEHDAIKLLYRDLPHPPSTHMGQSYQFRNFDGSGNAATLPDMGRSFTPYSRSCTSTHPLPLDELPDAGLVFDMLIRRDAFVPHPAGLSGLFFNWATTVIHSVFRTSRTNWNINETSSYVDLGILYGNTKYHIDRMRIVDGRGKILPDCFAETRITNLPLGVGAIIIMFNRNHNYIADRLLAINEKKTWTDDLKTLGEQKDKYFDSEYYTNKLEKQDYEIFQTARLINSLTYANVVLSDFLSGILGTQRDGSSWSLDITSERREADHTFLERGTGNSCSVEFNVLYRLHPSMSEDDEKYTEAAFAHIFQTTDWDSLTPEVFEFKVSTFARQALAAASKPKETPADPAAAPAAPAAASPATPPAAASAGSPDKPLDPNKIPTTEEYRKWTDAQRNQLKDDSQPVDYSKFRFGRTERDANTGKFPDAVLANALQQATSVPAAAFKARGVPNVMRVIEILGIEQARNWGACTMNEFRRFLGLRPYATFEEWNPDPKIADAARKLYRNTENLELYVGLVAEEPKPVGNGAGLCPSFTMARAILADAVALVRGDRYLTYDATPYNYTSWGFTEGARNVNNASFGGVLGKLFLRGLPKYYTPTSVWAHFPLVTPTGHEYSIDNVLRKLNKYEEYSHERPTKSGDTIVVQDPNFIQNILKNDTLPLVTAYKQNIADVKLNPSFLSVIDESAKYAKVTELVQRTFVPAEGLAAETLWFHDRTLELIKEKNLPIINVKSKAHAVDVVKDVFRLVPVHWASTRIAGLPIKTSFEPRGIYYEQQLYQMLKEIYTYIYQEGDPTMKIALRAEARENVVRLERFVKLSLLEAKGGVPASVLGSVANLFIGDGHTSANPTLRRLLDLKSPLDETTNDIIGVISTASIELSQIFTHVINFYLAPYPPNELDRNYEEEKKVYDKRVTLHGKIVALATHPEPDTPAELEKYVREALRHDPVTSGVYRVATANFELPYIADKGGKIEKGDKLWLDFRAAGENTSQFPVPTGEDPHTFVNTGLKPEDYAQLQGDGVFKVLGEKFVYSVAANVLRAVFSLPNVRRAKGPAGTLRRFKDVVSGPDDTLKATEVEIDEFFLGDDGKPKPTLDENGKPVDPKKVKIQKYSWVPAEGPKAWKYTYVNPEDNHHETPWATGLTINYDDY